MESFLKEISMIDHGIQVVELVQIFIALGGLGIAIKIAQSLTALNVNMTRALDDIKDHEDRIRGLEHQ